MVKPWFKSTAMWAGILLILVALFVFVYEYVFKEAGAVAAAKTVGAVMAVFGPILAGIGIVGIRRAKTPIGCFLVFLLPALVLSAGCVTADGQQQQLDPQKTYLYAQGGYNAANFALIYLHSQGKIDEETYAKLVLLRKGVEGALKTLKDKADANDPLGLEDALELFNAALAEMNAALEEAKPKTEPPKGET